MRDARGRFLPLSGQELADGSADGRHVFSRADRRKGYAILIENIRLGRIPSRIASSIRSKIRAHYTSKSDKRSA
jgi:hypothetical protein